MTSRSTSLLSQGELAKHFFRLSLTTMRLQGATKASGDLTRFSSGMAPVEKIRPFTRTEADGDVEGPEPDENRSH